MELQKALEQRRSTRAFTDRKLTRNEINEILRAGTLAPSACNMQSWYFYIVCDKAEREKFKQVCAPWVAEAPVVFIVCTDDREIVSKFGEQCRKFPIQDTALAMENMLLKAADMGLGGCIIGAYKQDEVEIQFPIREGHKVVALLPIGEPAREIPARERKAPFEVSDYIGEIAPAAAAYEKSADSEPFMLKKASLVGAEFEELNLENAKLKDINMRGASFTSVNLDTTSFSDMYFGNSSFKKMNLSGSVYQCGSLDRVKIGGCESCESEGIACIQMRNAVFDNVDMSGSQFNHCNYENNVMTDIRMCSSKVYDVDLDGSDFSGVNMVGMKMRCVNMYGTTVENSNFSGVQMTGCDIDGFTIDGVDVKAVIEEYKRKTGNEG